MKILLSFLVISTLVLMSKESKVEWLTETTHDFGSLRHEKPQTFNFRYRNVSKDSLWVDNVRASCGCTSPDWEDAAVAPGEQGLIKVEYDARDEGYFYKKIKVYFSGQRKPEILYIEGDVIK